MSDATSPNSSAGLDSVRQAYSKLAEGEKAKIMRFTARRRFTDDVFETWLKLSGLHQGELRREMIAERQIPPVREKLDSTLLAANQEGLLKDALAPFLAEGNGDLFKSVVDWAAGNEKDGFDPLKLKEAIQNGTPAGAIAEHAQFGLLREAALAGLLDDFVEETAKAPVEETSEQDSQESEAKSEETAESPAAPAEQEKPGNPVAVATAIAGGAVAAATAAAVTAKAEQTADSTPLSQACDDLESEIAKLRNGEAIDLQAFSAKVAEAQALNAPQTNETDQPAENSTESENSSDQSAEAESETESESVSEEPAAVEAPESEPEASAEPESEEPVAETAPVPEPEAAAPEANADESSESEVKMETSADSDTNSAAETEDSDQPEAKEEEKAEDSGEPEAKAEEEAGEQPDAATSLANVGAAAVAAAQNAVASGSDSATSLASAASEALKSAKADKNSAARGLFKKFG